MSYIQRERRRAILSGPEVRYISFNGRELFYMACMESCSSPEAWGGLYQNSPEGILICNSILDSNVVDVNYDETIRAREALSVHPRIVISGGKRKILVQARDRDSLNFNFKYSHIENGLGRRALERAIGEELFHEISRNPALPILARIHISSRDFFKGQIPLYRTRNNSEQYAIIPSSELLRFV